MSAGVQGPHVPYTTASQYSGALFPSHTVTGDLT
jgi:hypothetical protein